MNYKVDERYNAVVISMRGNFMGGPDGNDLREDLKELKEAGKSNVVVDLGKVKLMNSSGIGTLIAGMTSMRNAGGDLRLANVADRIKSLLVITKLITVFKHFESVEDALASYEGDASA